jgi:hypothetical protein
MRSVLRGDGEAMHADVGHGVAAPVEDVRKGEGAVGDLLAKEGFKG